MNRLNLSAIAVVTSALLMAGCGSAGDLEEPIGTGATITNVGTAGANGNATVTEAPTPPAATQPTTGASASSPMDVEPGTRVVVLVEADDVLNVRSGPGTGNQIVATLAPGAETATTGSRTTVGESIWSEVRTSDAVGWVNERHLGASLSASAFATDQRVLDLIERLVAVMRERGDLTTVASRRGLYISYHDEPDRFATATLSTVLEDPTTRGWSSAAGGDEARDLTFAEAVADPMVSVWDDPDRSVASDQPLAGGNGRIPEAAIPFTLRAFHYVSIFDPGDDPQFDGLDWTSWHISIDYEDDEPVVVGLTIDQWAP